MTEPGRTDEPARARRRPRPELHFTPPANWMNDPNGLIVLDDTFHLFYQHNPHATRWGNLHWGHATSRDLTTWEHHPVAIAPDALGQAFSGTVVLDDADTAGFGAGALVAVYTQDLDGVQRQSLAFSVDGGERWVPYDGNPVIERPDGERDFRDPKVLRYDSTRGSWWVMLLGVGADVWVYRSDDLRQWRRTSTLTIPSPWPGSVVEVPELVPVPVGGTGDERWTLIVSLIPPGRARRVGGRVRLAAVDFDGETVVPRDSPADTVPLDGGRDFYAAMAWGRTRSGPPVCVGWLDERNADFVTAGAEWCGRLSLPRALTWVEDHGELRLRQAPVLPKPRHRTDLGPGGGDRLEPTVVPDHCFVVSLVVDLPPGTGTASARITLASRAARVSVIVDRAGASLADGHDVASGRHAGAGDVCRRDVLVIVDAGSIEVFLDGGLGVLSEIASLGLEPTAVTVEVDGAATLVSAWLEGVRSTSETAAT